MKQLTDQQFIDACREHRLTVARRIRYNALKRIGTDLDVDCGDNVLARVMQCRLREVLEIIEEGLEFAGK